MFELFARTVDGMPPRAVLSLLKRESESIKDALRHKRIQETQEIGSILSFCQFMDTIAEEGMVFPVAELPVRHIGFYRKIVMRLIDAGEIPESTKAKFDTAFSLGFLRSLASN
jgi:hypothetical protein